jgi:hypothetical protein
MMKMLKFRWVKLLLVFLLTLVIIPNLAWSFSGSLIHHRLKIELEPSSRFATIKDVIELKPSGSSCKSFALYLHADLKLNQVKVPTGWELKSSRHKIDEVPLVKLEIVKSSSAFCPETILLELSYSGVLFDPDSDDAAGFFFSSSSYFYPQAIENSLLLTFTMEVSLPEPWQAVSQGQRFGKEISGGGRSVVTWRSTHSSEGIYLIGNRFHFYETIHNGISLFAYLLQKEDALAERYLETAKKYIDFYSKLIGSYPYKKFALIENARQTGFGMPSFALMGSRIIRFPFILHSSYPHEILHNWWGNGVFPKMRQGNWSEGLTTYLADHLLLEMKGKGAPYRFQALMKFLNYVNKENDFPLSEFGHRESMASQAIGYAKLSMVFHMLRMEVGDENFLKSLKRFYETYKYRYAGYDELRWTFEEISDQSLSGFFEQWVLRRGAPKISLKEASYVFNKFRYDLSMTIEQLSPAFRLKLPVAIWTTGSEVAEIHHVELKKNRQVFQFYLEAEPVAVRLDPYNDVFRLIGEEEAPASLAQAYGAQIVTALLPARENLDYKKFAQAVAEPERILTGDSNSTLSEGSLWVFGKDHPLRKTFIAELKKSKIEVGEKGIRFSDHFYPWEGHSFIFTIFRSDKKKGTMTWVIAGNAESISGLMRKLPHYGKYGYLVFEGFSPRNQDKGIWPSNPTGLQRIFKEGLLLNLPEQKPLAQFRLLH